MKKNIFTGGDGLNLGEEDHLEVTNHAALAAGAFMTSLISSLVRWRTRGTPEGELVTTMTPDGRVVVVYLSVMTGRLFSEIWRALVCAAAVYMVLRR